MLGLLQTTLLHKSTDLSLYVFFAVCYLNPLKITSQLIKIWLLAKFDY